MKNHDAKARKGHVSGIKWLLYGLRLQSRNPAVCITCTSFFPTNAINAT